MKKVLFSIFSLLVIASGAWADTAAKYIAARSGDGTKQHAGNVR